LPELPEVNLYLHALRPRILGERLTRIRIRSPSLLRSVDPPPSAAHGKDVVCLRRIGKRVALGLEGDLFLVVHLMIAGRFQWKNPGAAIPRRLGHAAFDFANGTLMLTEAGTHKRASLHVVQGECALAEHDPGGIEPLECSVESFTRAIRRQNRTLKRVLADPAIVSGIGNAHSDEILWRARLSPVALTGRMSDADAERLFSAVRESLAEWSARLVQETGDRFPKKVTAFHPAMAAHGKYGEACPRCGTPIQRIVYATRETNYCPGCQTGGKLLADRAISRLLRQDWPRSVEELEAHRSARRT